MRFAASTRTAAETRSAADTRAAADAREADGTFFRVACLGDSMSDNDDDYPARLAVLMGATGTTLRKGVAGERTDQMRTRLATQVFTEKLTGVMVLGGVNDILQNNTAAQIKTSLENIYNDIIAEGLKVYTVAILPFGGYSQWTAAREAVRKSVNAWMAQSGHEHVNAEPAMSTGSAARPALTSAFAKADQLHPSLAGSGELAERIYAQAFTNEELTAAPTVESSLAVGAVTGSELSFTPVTPASLTLS